MFGWINKDPWFNLILETNYNIKSKSFNRKKSVYFQKNIVNMFNFEKIGKDWLQRQRNLEGALEMIAYAVCIILLYVDDHDEDGIACPSWKVSGQSKKKIGEEERLSYWWYMASWFSKEKKT